MTGQSRRENKGPLRDHVRDGKRFRPPLLASGVLTVTDWYRDDLPDHIWPSLFVGSKGAQGAGRFTAMQRVLIEEFGPEFFSENSIAFDGRLTELEKVPVTSRENFLSTCLEADEELLETGNRVMSLYESPPGWWLFESAGEPSVDEVGLATTWQELVLAVGQVVGDRHLNALVKSIRIAWLLSTSGLTITPEMGEKLLDYPMNETNRSAADSSIRATYLATKDTSPESIDSAKEWARQFWDTNYNNTSCFLDSDEQTDEFAESAEPAGPTDTSGPNDVDMSDLGRKLTAELAEAASSLYSRATESSEVVDLYSHSKCEVILGHVSVCTRHAFRLFATPWMWSGEFGSGVLRKILESQIQIAWMMEQPATSDVFERFQEYGRGKRKLMRVVLAEKIKVAEESGIDIPTEVTAAEEKMARDGGGRWSEELREVSVEGTFAPGKTLRSMAIEAGLADTYREQFQPTSGVVHSEWWAMEDYAMEVCLNPLHLIHWVPLDVTAGGIEPQAARNVQQAAFSLLAIAEDALCLAKPQFRRFDPRE